jgi:hypothetical protein
MNSDVKTNPNPSFAKFIGGIGVVILIVAAIGSMFNSGSTTGSSVLERSRPIHGSGITWATRRRVK